MTVRNIRAHQARGPAAAAAHPGPGRLLRPVARRRLEQIRLDAGGGPQPGGHRQGPQRRPAHRDHHRGVHRHRARRRSTPDDLLEQLGIEPDRDDGTGELAEKLGLIELDGDRIRMEMPALLPVAEDVPGAWASR